MSSSALPSFLRREKLRAPSSSFHLDWVSHHTSIPTKVKIDTVDSLLTGADFHGQTTSFDVTGHTLDHCNLSHVTALNSFLKNVTFTNCDLKGALLSRSTLENVLFINCDLTQTSLAHTDLDQVAFKDCNLDRTEFSSAKAAGLTLPQDASQARLVGAYVDKNSPLPRGYTRLVPEDLPAPQMLFDPTHNCWATPGRPNVYHVDYDLDYLFSHSSEKVVKCLLADHQGLSVHELLGLSQAVHS